MFNYRLRYSQGLGAFCIFQELIPAACPSASCSLRCTVLSSGAPTCVSDPITRKYFYLKMHTGFRSSQRQLTLQTCRYTQSIQSTDQFKFLSPTRKKPQIDQFLASTYMINKLLKQLFCFVCIVNIYTMLRFMELFLDTF